MARGNTSQGPFFSSAMSISNASSKVGGTDYTAHAVPVWDRESIAIQMAVKGSSSAASGAVSFKFYASLDGETFDTTPYASRSVDMDGVSAVRKTSALSVRGLHSLKCNRVSNADASNAASSVDAKWGKAYGG